MCTCRLALYKQFCLVYHQARSFQQKWRSHHGTKAASLPLHSQNRKRHRFPQSPSPDNNGTTGITVETLDCKRKISTEEAEEGEEESKSVPTFTRVPPYHWDMRQFKYIILSTRSASEKTYLPICTTRFLSLPFHSTEIGVSRSVFFFRFEQ